MDNRGMQNPQGSISSRRSRPCVRRIHRSLGRGGFDGTPHRGRSKRSSAGRLAAGLLFLATVPCWALQDPLDVPHKKILVTTTINAGDDRTATLTEFFTGDKNEKTAINILLGLHRGAGKERKLLASRDYNAEGGGFVSRSSLQVIDLDRDGANEILVEYHHKEKPGSTRVDLDVFRIVNDRLVLVWSGPIRVDTSATSLGLPPSEREKYVREIDFVKTSAAGGRQISFRRIVSVAAGAVFDPPRAISEDLDLTGSAASPSTSPVK